MRAHVGLATGWVVVIASTAVGQPKPAPLDRADLDRRAAEVVFAATTAGTEIYNRGNVEGCYRLYQGTLMALGPMLDHRPTLAATVTAALLKSKAEKTAADSAFVLREALDAVRGECTGKPVAPKKDVKPPAAPAPKADVKAPLWDRLGGEAGVRAAVREFYGRAKADPKVDLFRGNRFALDPRGYTRMVDRTIELVSEATGGPLKYTGKSMADAHKDMRVTADEFDAMAGHLVGALKQMDVRPTEIDELAAIVARYKKDIVEVK